EYDVAGMKVKVAVVSGLANAREVLEKVQNGEADYQFIEIMACPGGCVNGGGQPQVAMGVRNFVDIREKRAEVLRNLDSSMPLRQSHENPAVKALYEEYLEKPGSHKAHEILHTSYVKRSVN
ncbi:MAG: iron hydrogenase small subunit, partial [Ruminococcus sp.]|nr:iron hydrogenase small subunit [Ruminococcus sp.]